MGNYIPKAVLTSPNNTEIWGDIAYRQINKKSLKALAKSVKKIANGELEPESFTELFFPNKNGKLGFGWTGTPKFIKDNRIFLKKEDGSNISIGKSSVFDHSWQAAKRMIGSNQPAAASKPKQNTIRLEQESNFTSWRNKEGKTISAKFLKLKENELTLHHSNGKIFTISLNNLAPDSITKAKALASQQEK